MPRACATCAVAEGRREFVTKALLAAVGTFVLHGCGDGDIGGPGAPTAPPPISGGKLVINVGGFPALAVVGGIARVDGGTGTPIAAVRTSTESFLAFSMVCTHAGFSPIDIVAGGFRCPNHGAEFNSSGEWTGGQATTGLFPYATSFDAATGVLTIG